MKLSAILEPLVEAGVDCRTMLATVRAWEADKNALIASLVPAGERIRSRQWEKIRQRILKRDAYVCSYCGSEATDVDHVQSIKCGGSNEDENLVASCGFCNRSKGAKPLSEWRVQN